MPKGKLIVFEGVDGSGTTTQVAKLHQKLTSVAGASHQTAQPSSRPTGKMIREILGGRVIENPSYQTMSLLFAADRQDQQDNEILPALNAGTFVVCDRYVHSSVIYQSVSANCETAQTWIKEINRHIVQPDLVIYLKIDADTAKTRRQERGGEEEIFDKLEFQRKLIAEYDKIETIFPNDRFLTINGTHSVDKIAQLVWIAVAPLLDSNT